MTTEADRRTIAHYEGMAIYHVGQAGELAARDFARNGIDGFANALVRIAGREEAAGFVFALGDRIAGGIRGMTFRPPPPRWEDLNLGNPAADVARDGQGESVDAAALAGEGAIARATADPDAAPTGSQPAASAASGQGLSLRDHRMFLLGLLFGIVVAVLARLA